MDLRRLLKAGFKLTALASFFAWHLVLASPENGNVVAGSAQISQTQNQTVINQTSQNAVINWNNFNTTSTESVLFNQPNSNSIALNRITSGTPTSFDGSLTANGHVWILNPAGIVFGANSKIDVAGLLATTHDITNNNFMMGIYKFDLVPGFENSKIINNGLITARDSGIVALVAPGVENNGIITANLGKVYLSSGSTYVVDLYGDNLINFGSSPAVQKGYVSNSGKIIASGGKVVMTANSAGQIVNDVVSMSGVIEATTTTTGRHGGIILNGGSSGVTRVSGKLKASGGGHIETSGHVLVIESTAVIDAGMGGSWLVDPFNIIVAGTNSNNSGPPAFTPTGNDSNIDVALISAQLSAGTNVTLDTGDAISPGAQAGDITVATPITWTSTSTLTLSAFRNIYLNADITALNGGLSLSAVYAGSALTIPSAANVSITSGSFGSPSATGVTANINVRDFNLLSGVWFQLNAALPQFNISNSFSLSSDRYVTQGAGLTASYMRALGGTGAVATPYQLTDIYGIQGINANDGSTLLTKFYTLANNIDATGTRTWNSGLGFRPIGYWNTFYQGFVFQGNFNGNSNVINGLYVNRSQTENGTQGEMGSALFSVTGAGANIHDLGLTNVDITSQNDRAGGLIAFGTYQSTTTVSNVYVTGKVTTFGGCCTGGVVGYIGSGFLSTLYNNATVTANGGSDVGGVVGYLLGASLTNSYNVGKIYAVGTVSNVGGLVGTSTGSPVITNTYNSGPVNNAFGTAGALIGFYNTGTITSSYFDTQTSVATTAFGTGSTSGVTPLTTLQMMTASNFVGWTIADGTGSPASNVFSGATPPSSVTYTWLILPGNTRPMLNMEWSTSIKIPHQLQLMAVAKNGSYSLAYNIDLYDGLTSASDVWGTNFNFPSGAGFVPIGGPSASTAFAGTFNGNNLIINNLYINRPTTNYVGLFGVNIGSGTTISNVGLTNVNVTGQSNVGGLLGQNSNGGSIPGGTGVPGGNVASNITNVYVTGAVNSVTFTGNNVGGLIGLVTFGAISNSYSTANVSASSTATNVGATNIFTYASGGGIGGLIGDNYGTVTQSYATGNVTMLTPGAFIGGLLGFTIGSPIDQSYSSGTVTAANGSKWIGGFVGYESSNVGFPNTITNSYSVSNIITSGSSVIGGFVGLMQNDFGLTPIITNSYSTGSITGSGNTFNNGFVGQYVAGTTTNNFWDTQSSGIATDPRSGLGDTGRTTVQMETTATFSGATWSITDVPSITAAPPANTWFIFPGQTRPMLMMENTPNVGTPHAVQMMGAALGGNYTLIRNIDFTNMFNNVSEVWATNRNTPTGEGFVPVGNAATTCGNGSQSCNFTGTLNGAGEIINALYINKTITSGNAGLFGIANNATIRNLSVTNASISQSAGTNASGIVAGILSGTSALTTSYASGSINNTGDTGGLVGDMLNTASIANAYNLATVNSNTSGFAGGVVGNMVSGTPSVTNTYSTNIVNATTTPGGVIGNFGAGSLLNNVWDTQTSNISSLSQGCGNVANCAGVKGMTTAQMMDVTNFTTPGNGFVTSPWSITATSSTSRYAPVFTWFEFNATNGKTRPMLMIENNQNIVNAHQLQMMGAALGGTYQLLNNIDLVNGLTDIHDVWNTNYSTPTGLGFVPVGAGSAATAFQGFFRGQNYVINNLYINRPTQNFIGLFGTNINNGATINNVGLTNANITGQAAVGGIVGQNSNSGAAGFTGGTTINQTGNTYSNIFKVYVSGAVNATSSLLGGISGLNSFGIISYSYETANVLATGASPIIGGFVGENMGVITASYAAGTVTTQVTGASSIGGFAGVNFYGQINQSYSTGSVYAATGSTNVGGFVGLSSSSSFTNAQNLLTNDYSFSNVLTSNSTNVGGFVGSMAIGSGNVPTTSNSFSMGAILGSGNTNQGGFGGNYAVTAVTTNNFWDKQRSGIATDVRASGKTTIEMMTPSTFSTWNTATIWNILSGHTYPFLRVFYSGTPQAISGTSTAVPDSLITIALNGSVLNTVPVGANSFFYELNGLNNISLIDTSLPSGGLILAYQSGSATIGNDIAVITSSIASLSGIYDSVLNPVGNGLILSVNTVTAGNTGTTSGGLSNTQLSTAKGLLSDAGIIYAVSSNNLTENVNKHFATTLATTYTLDGNITLTNGNATINGPLLISAASPVISTTSSGIINFNNTVNGTVAATKSLTVTNTNPSASSIVFSSPIGASASLNNLSLTGNTQYNSGVGATVFTVGTEIYNGALVLNNIPTLSLNGTSVTFGGAVTDVTAATSLTIPGNLIVNSTGSIGQSGQILNSLTVTGATSNGGNITTTNNQLYNGAYTLTGTHALTSNAGNITFGSTVDGGFNLSINALGSGVNFSAGPGIVTFNGIVGGGPALTSLSVTSYLTAFNTSLIHTTGTQSYAGVNSSSAVGINVSNINFQGSSVSFAEGVQSRSAPGPAVNANVTITGNLILLPPNGDLFHTISNIFSYDYLTSLHVTGTSSINTGVVTYLNQTYDSAVTLVSNTAFILLNAGTITFGSTLDSTGGPFSATISTSVAGSVVNFNGIVGGNSTTPALSALSISGDVPAHNPAIHINTTGINTTGAQTYTGVVTLGADTTLTSTTAGINFSSTVDSDTLPTARALTLTSPLVTTLTGNIGSLVKLKSLTITNASDIKTAAISTTTFQTYGGAVTLDNIAALNLTGTNITFNSPVDSKTTSTALTITGNLIVGASGSIGLNFAAPGNVHVGSIFVSGTTLGPNTNTSGNQTYTLGVTLNTDETMTSTAGKISFGSTINGDGVLGRNLTLNAVSGTGSVTFNGIVGGSVPLSSLIVNAGSITINTTAISTSGVQNYMSPSFLTIQPAAMVTLTGSEIDFNQNVFGNPAGSLTINGNLVLNTPNGSIPTNIINTIIVNGSTTINANILTPYITASQNATFNGPITVLGPGFGGVQPAVLSVGTGILTVNGTIDGPGPLELFTGGAGIVNVNGAVGGTTPLSSFQIAGFGGTPSTANINTATIHTVNDQTYTNLAMVLDQNTVWTSNAGGIVLNSGTTVNALTVGGESLQLIAAPGVGVTLTGNIGNINKLSSLTIGSNLVATPAGIQTSAISTTVSQTYYGSVDVDNISALNLTTGLVTFNDTVISTTISTALTINGNLVLNTPKGGMPSSTFNTIIVNGSTTINSGITTPYITASQNATFNGSVTVLGPGLVGGQPAVLGVGTGILTVNGTIDGPGPLELITGGVGIVNVNGAVGGTTPLSSFQILGFGGTPTTANINTATIHTVNNQTYTNLAMVLDQNTVWTSNAGGINFNSAASTINALTNGGESLQLISPNTVSLIGNIGNINKLSSLTIGSNLVATPASISTPSIATTISQTYFGPVLFQSLGAINFTHTNLTFPNAITFNNTVNSVATSTAMTITGNLAVGPSGSIGLQFASPGNVHVGSILVTGTTLGPNTNTSGDQTYAGALTLNTDETMTSTAGRITFGSTVDGDGVLGRNLNVNANSGAFGAVRFNGVVGGLIPLASLASTVPTGGFSTAFNTTSVTTTGTQTYSGIVVVNNTNNPTNFNFSGSTVSFNDVLATGVFSPTNLVNITITGNFVLTGPNGNIQTQLGGLQVNSLHVTGASTFSNPNLFTGVNVLSYQTYDGPVSLNVDNVIFAIQNPGSVITFGSTLQSNGGPWGVQIVLGTPTSVVNFNGIVGGVGGSNPLSSLDFTNFGDPSATININTSQINTTGLQNYRGIVRLGTDTTLTSTTSGMTFSSTVDSNTAVVANARALTLVSPLTVTLSGNIGSINKLKSLTIGSGLVATPANISTPSITTTTSQTYFGPVTLNSPTVTLTSGITPTITGIITFNNSINAASSGVQSLVVNANNGPATGNVFFNNSVGAVTPLNSITVNSGTVTMNNNSIANFLVHTTGVGADPIGSQVYSGTLTSPGTVTLTSDSENISFFNANGAAFKLIANAPNGAVILTSGGTISINTLDITGLTYLPQGGFIDTTGASVYNGSILLNTLIPGDQVWFGGLTTVTVHGSVYTQLGATATVTLNQSSPTFIIDGNMGDITTLVVKGVNIQTEHMNALVVFGSLVFNGNFIRSVGIQRYMQPVTFTAPTVNLINDSNGAIYGVGINFFNTPVSGLNTDLITQGDTYFGRLVASGITPITVTLKSFTNTAFLTDIVGGSSITTTNAQTYGGQVILDNIGNNNAVTLAGSTMTFNGAVLQNPNVTPVGLIITGNMVANAVIGPSNISGGFFAGQNGTLRSLTVNGQSNLNGGLVNTTNNQLYNGPVLLGATNLLNSNLGNITFNSTIDNNFNLTVDAIQTRFKGVVGTTPIGALTVNSNIINFSNAVTSVTSSGIQTYTGTGVNPLMTIGLDPVFTAPSFVIAIAVLINADTTYNSTAGNIDFQQIVTGDGVSFLHLNPVGGSAMFESTVGTGGAPLGSLVINGTSLFDQGSAQVVNTTNNQTYFGGAAVNLVTLNNNITMTSQSGIVSFSLGAIDVAGITGPAFNLSIFTFNPANGPTGAGIAGTVHVANFTMGGTGGGNVSPLLADYSTVGGSSGVGAWNNTVIDPAATGLYCVNGNCISGSRVLNIDANNEIKTYGQIITPNSVADVAKITTTGLAPGDSVTNITLTSLGYPQTATVLGGPYVINASGASGPGLANHYTSIVYGNTPGFVTVNTAPLTVTGNNIIKTYGQTITFTGTEFNTTGTFYNGDNITSVTLNSPGAVSTANVAGSTYPVTPSAAVGTGLSNYSITYSPSGTIAVNPAAVTITSSSQSKNYGTTLSPTTSAFTTDIVLPNSETIGTVDIVSAGLSPAATVLGGPYAITGVSNAAGGTFDPNNYAITYAPAGSITVNPLAVNITSSSQSKNYGTTLSPTTNAFTTNIVLPNSETIGTVDIVSAGLSPTASVLGGPYAITGVSNAAGGTFDPTNYAITYTPAGSITVNPLAVTITSTSQSKNYGTTLSPTTNAFTTNIVLPNSETIGTVDIASAGLSPTASVLGGPYAITGVSNAAGGTFDVNNYNISYTPAGSITVNPLAVTITSSPQTKTFGVTLPPATTFFTTDIVLPNSETIGTVDIVSAGLPGSAPVGSYSIDTASNATGGTFDINNYTINYVAANNITVTGGPTPTPTPTPTPMNIPPTQVFPYPIDPTACGASGCGNVEIIKQPNNCAYSNIGIEDYISNPMARKVLLKQEEECACQTDNKWMKYCRANIKHVVYTDNHKLHTH
jgi:filamentous hemagglutinin family protein